ncbi:hypothetical protein ATCC90586_006516 [Pythium insidiosum]|nr:hypothetical protein ATCC90586_006516 [Pythium insidiosum]
MMVRLNRVGVANAETLLATEEEGNAQSAIVEASEGATAEDLERKRKQVQKEQLRKKKAERPEINREIEDDWEELNSIDPQSGDGSVVAHSRFLSRGRLRVFVGTWNLHAKKPPSDALRRWLPRNRYHIVAVGTEECLHSIARSVVFASKKPWEDQLREVLGHEYVVVASHALTAIHNVVFVHESVVPWLHGVQSDAVATGLGNQLGNKGGVGIAFSIGRTSFAFVNCHFDAHQHNVHKRNANFHRINQELRLEPLRENVSPSRATSRKSGRASFASAKRTTVTSVTVADAFDHVFWYGDLNYRINGTRRMIDRLLLHQQHAVLRFNDQLLIEMTRGNVLSGFSEGPLHFRPTYKFDKHSDAYDSSGKQRIPSWTDRVLFKSNLDEDAPLQQLSYRSDMTR